MQVHEVQRSPIDVSPWATEEVDSQETRSFRGPRSREGGDQLVKGLSHRQHPQAGTETDSLSTLQKCHQALPDFSTFQDFAQQMVQIW